jgi:hypothetical protein
MQRPPQALKTNIKYNFKGNRDPEMCYKPEKIEYTYYQICHFPNPSNELYGVRRIKINEYHEVTNVKEKYYNKKKIDKFTQRIPINKYKVYATYILDDIELPNYDQIVGANSELLK